MELMEEVHLLDRLKARYYGQWQNSDPTTWADLRLKLDMIDDLKAEIKSLVNSKD